MINIKKSWSKVLTSAALVLPAGIAGAHSLANSQATVASETSAQTFWNGFHRSHALSTEGYETLEAMADSSDAVVIGRVVSYSAGRIITTDSTNIVMAVAEIEVERQLRGKTEQEVYPVEFVVTGSIDSALAQIDDQAANLPKEAMVLFLHEKQGKGEEGLFRLTSDLGLWQELDGQLVTPLGDEVSLEQQHEHGADHEHAEEAQPVSLTQQYREETGNAKSLADFANFLENQ